jgi:hypothetical protein
MTVARASACTSRRAARQLDRSNVVKIHDVIDDGGPVVIVMSSSRAKRWRPRSSTRSVHLWPLVPDDRTADRGELAPASWRNCSPTRGGDHRHPQRPKRSGGGADGETTEAWVDRDLPTRISGKLKPGRLSIDYVL